MDDTAIDSNNRSNHYQETHLLKKVQKSLNHIMSTLVIDPSDPFFLHASDHLGMVLVFKVLDRTNYVM